ncbi:hypothetical protein [Saccharothrix sp. ST-888]|uniref:hypothetical protein n=1 Tax=Saccharothrix sp. ST-888 TaxID=1427391 RepID=UPI000696180C|nr:hypothetical protein [Saccharothrix sp. ST-888]
MMRKYAEAGIPCLWRVEDEDGGTTVHRYELDTATTVYVASGTDRGTLATGRPFPVSIDLHRLTP